MNPASRKSAVRTRVLSIDLVCRQCRCVGFAQLFAGAAKAALALAEGLDGDIQRGGVELGPQQVGEIKLRVGQLPEQEVADALLAAGADEEIGLRRMRH